MLCPLDKSVLQACGEDATPIFFCETCHGLWLSRDQLALLLRSGKNVKISPKSKVLSVKVQRSTTQCFCPSCAKAALFAKVVDGVEIDVCSHCCGIWLDAGELDLIIARYRRKQKLHVVSDGASEFLVEAASNADVLFNLGELLAHGLGQSAEWVSEAGPALLDFLAEAFSSIDF